MTQPDVLRLEPDFAKLKTLNAGVIATAPGEKSDCVVRYFAPAFGIDEDAGTGSIHCALTPYWSERLRKNTVHSRQLSRRGGTVGVRLSGARVHLLGTAVTVLAGTLHL